MDKMSNTLILDAKSNRVVTHAIGAGYGESVVLTVGGRLVVGFDCCDALVRPGHRGLTYLERILSGCHEPHVIWVLTHFHFDHFQSFTTLLDQIGVHLKKIFVPGNYTSADLADLSNEARADGGLQEFYRAKDEYSRLKRQLESPSLSPLVGTFVGSYLFNIGLRLPTGKMIPIDADLFGPNYQVAEEVGGQGVKEYEEDKKTKRTHANHTSYIARVRAGQFDSLFLGDSPAVRTIGHGVRCNDSVNLFVLKVAHHGAEDGTSADLLACAGNNATKRVALVCPFKAHGLPKASVLESLENAGFQPKVCGPQRPSQRLKDLVLSGADLPVNKATLEVYSHGSNARIVRGRL